MKRFQVGFPAGATLVLLFPSGKANAQLSMSLIAVEGPPILSPVILYMVQPPVGY